MGGFGSGRPAYGGRITRDYRALDVRRLQRDGRLIPGLSYSWQWTRNQQPWGCIHITTGDDYLILEFRLRRDDDWQDYRQVIPLERTPCHFGGQRVWFRCPHCGKTVALLYGVALFACRTCQRLSYASQNETELDRAYRRLDKVRQHLGWTPGVSNGHGSKPKGMHWRTYYQLLRQHQQESQTAFACLAYCLDGLQQRLDDLAKR